MMGERVLTTTVQARARLEGAERERAVASDCLAEAEAAVGSEEFKKRERCWEKAAGLVVQLESGRDGTDRRLSELRYRAVDLPDQVKGNRSVALSEYARSRRVEADRELEAASARLADAEAAVGFAEFKEREKRVEEAARLVIQMEARQEAADRASADVVLVTTTVESDERSVEKARSALDTAQSDLDQAEAAAKEADSNLKKAEHRLLDARHADMAGSLRGRMTSGDECPVCEQPVHEVPPTVGGDTAAAEEAVDQARSERENSERRLRTTTGIVEATKAGLTAAERRLAESRRRLAETLQTGEQQRTLLDICCDELGRLLGEGDPVVRLGEERSALDAFRAAVERARTVRDEKRAALDDAVQRWRRAQEDLSNLRTEIVGVAALLQTDFQIPEGDPEAVRAALTSLHTQWNRTTTELERTLQEQRTKAQAESARLAEERSALDAFRAAVERARTVRDEKRAALDDAVQRDRRAQEDLSNLRTEIVGVAALLQTDFQIPEGDPEAVRAALTSLHTQWNRTTTELERIVQDERTRVETASIRLAEARTEHGIEGSMEAALAEVRAKRGHIEAGIEQDEKLVADVVKLLDERRKWKQAVRLNRRLVRDLTDARFIRFLLDEERAVLAGLGSEHFERLSSGRYRFTEDGAFHVVDLNSADTIRRADSLSGGETFLASLGLALGLAEMVGRRGGRLDAFFLDEGFGTLDPEHLDLAMEGIETLVADREQRLVVVVSHVPELRQRLDDLIELDKDGVTGNSIVVGG